MFFYKYKAAESEQCCHLKSFSRGLSLGFPSNSQKKLFIKSSTLWSMTNSLPAHITYFWLLTFCNKLPCSLKLCQKDNTERTVLWNCDQNCEGKETYLQDVKQHKKCHGSGDGQPHFPKPMSSTQSVLFLEISETFWWMRNYSYKIRWFHIMK